ncbi:hypothetical protein PsorP6_007691 [Peronosclerospora sorghi]|uniref:Uncharacterized protein n=1 Tax=Peronosclerospora sorghi TaxID=230839 RepID=A0ACC0WB15_9STRA|nr:hypothetical protein PsorP6_007691 [Peronosclerospora sorghi]
MKNLLQLSVVFISVVLVPLIWYSTLMPQWLAQSGERNETVYYTQGMGIWLNYTEHVGDLSFDPGNSLLTQQAFCARTVGELHKQFCQVMEVYCGPAITFLQLMLSVMAGVALLVVIWSIHVITTTRCTIADTYLMHLCVFNCVGCLASALVWYFFVFRRIMNSAFYQDQFNRCSENNTNRTCWQFGVCVYFLVAGGMLYLILAVLVTMHVTNKFRCFNQLLQHMYETAALIDVPPPLVDLKTLVVATRKNETIGSAEMALDVEEYLRSTKLEPLKKHPSAVF